MWCCATHASLESKEIRCEIYEAIVKENLNAMWCIPPPPPQNLHLSTGQSENHETCESRQSCNYAEYLRCSNCLISWERITIVGLHTNHSPFIAGSILEVFVVTKDSWRLTLLCSGTCSEILAFFSSCKLKMWVTLFRNRSTKSITLELCVKLCFQLWSEYMCTRIHTHNQWNFNKMFT